MDCSLPGSSIHGIFQARVLEWGAIAFSGYDTKSTSDKRKSDTLDFIKIKTFHTSKDTVRKVKRQSKEWEKYL